MARSKPVLPNFLEECYCAEQPVGRKMYRNCETGLQSHSGKPGMRRMHPQYAVCSIWRSWSDEYAENCTFAGRSLVGGRVGERRLAERHGSDYGPRFCNSSIDP